MRQWQESCQLAWQDWKHEYLLSLCAVLALASMLSPILVLMGLKNGLLEGMRQKLLRDPTVLIITPKSDAGQFSPEFIEGLMTLPGARYAVGRTRDTSTDVPMLNLKTGQRQSVAFEPASPGEPVLENLGYPVPKNGPEPEITLSASAAKSLGVNKGDTLQANVGRRSPEGKLESIKIPLLVNNVLPPETADRKMAFAPATFMEDLENYRDYLAVPSRGWPGREAPEKRLYASFRLYASSLDAVASLADWLEQHKIETITRSREIAAIQSLENAINNVILIISFAVGAGFVAFTVSSSESAIKRKNKMLGLLRLFGFRRLALTFFPLAQSFFTALAGFLFSLALYLGASMAIGRIFSSQGLEACILRFSDILTVAACVILLSIFASGRGAWSASKVEPSSVIREI